MRMSLALLCLIALPAMAQSAPTVAITVATGNTPTVTWDCQAAAACDASGPPSWAGTKANSGSQVVASITDTATYLIKATSNGKDFFDLSWAAVTKNTDGTTATDIAGYEILSGPSATSLTLEKSVAANVTAYRSTGNAPGVRYFAVRAFNTPGVRSGNSGVGSGTATAAQSASASVTLKVPAATGLTVN